MASARKWRRTKGRRWAWLWCRRRTGLPLESKREVASECQWGGVGRLVGKCDGGIDGAGVELRSVPWLMGKEWSSVGAGDGASEGKGVGPTVGTAVGVTVG